MLIALKNHPHLAPDREERYVGLNDIVEERDKSPTGWTYSTSEKQRDAGVWYREGVSTVHTIIQSVHFSEF